MQLVDANGTAVASYDYDPYGKVISATGTMAEVNPIRYRGYVYDTESGLYYITSRYYDPEIGRWLNADDTAYLGADGTLLSNNLFAYCSNNPVNKIDKTGNLGLAIGIFIGVSSVIGGLAGAFTAVCTGSNVLESVIEGAVLGAVAATATVFVPQLIAPLASTVASTVATTTAAQAMVATAVTTGATFTASGFAGMAVDGAAQWISHEMGENSSEEFKLDMGRMYKTGLTTGIAGVIPTYGDPAKEVVNAIGSLISGFDASFVNAAIEIAVTKLNS